MFTLSEQSQPILNVIKDSLKLYKLAFLALLPFTFFYTIFFIAPNVVLHTYIVFWKHNVMMQPKHYTHLLILLQFIFGACVMVFFAGLIDQCIHTANNAIRTQWQSFVIGIRKFLFVFIATWFCLIFIMIGLVLFIIPGIYLSIALMFFPVFIVIENNGPWNAIKKSYELIRHHWWRTFVVMLPPFILQAAAAKIMELLFGHPILLPTIGHSIHDISTMGHILLGISLLITIPWTVTTLICQYHDLKLRNK
ncbi:MAG: hypothetical protein ABIH77_04860 [Pseudomonadota bacterium]